MSSSIGMVVKDQKVVGYFEYDGTADVAISAIRRTSEEVWKARDERDTLLFNNVWRRCTCSNDHDDVLLYTDYGWGFYWPAKVCLLCKAITTNTMPREGDIKIMDGLPPGISPAR